LFDLVCAWAAGDQLLDIDSGRETGLHAKPTQHFTVIFNTFVMMTLFNEVNARKIHGQRNVFEGLNRNVVFITIWICTFVAQVDISISIISISVILLAAKTDSGSKHKNSKQETAWINKALEVVQQHS